MIQGRQIHNGGPGDALVEKLLDNIAHVKSCADKLREKITNMPEGELKEAEIELLRVMDGYVEKGEGRCHSK